MSSFERNREIARQRALADAARRADPTEQAVRHIRSRGHMVARASVFGRNAEHWHYQGRDLTSAKIIAVADRLQARAALIGTPAHFTSLPQPEREPDMRNIAIETENCAARGTTPQDVRTDLNRLRGALGAQAFTAVNVGLSTFGNTLSGNKTIGDAVLTGLYGDAGCTLRPELLRAVSPEFVPDLAPAADAAAAGADAVTDALTDAIAQGVIKSGITLANPVELQIHGAATIDPATLESLTVAALVARAQGRKAWLDAEMARIDAEISAANDRRLDLLEECDDLDKSIAGIQRLAAQVHGEGVPA
ncbi:MAG TPA: hypothetical protein PK808_11260 [Polymorphobacter sp.]|nr:hypothetical protein [Polymorphobacter sp.]